MQQLLHGSARRRGAVALSLAALVLAPLATAEAAHATPAGATTAGSGVVISEVYGSGGNSGAAWARDYIELYNPTDSPIDVSGMSVQYRSAGGTANPSGVTALTGTIEPQGYYLVAEAGGTSGGTSLPPAAVTGNFNLSGTSGTVFLARQTGGLTAPPTGSLVGDPLVADLVGFGSSNTFETSAAPSPGATTSIARDADGTDSDDNSVDLAPGAGTPGEAPGGSTPPPTGTVPIATIQGTTDVSPYVGETVTTEGVVTAAYPTGGFNGFYLQTPGTGGDVDLATHTKSDGIFVYGSAFAGQVHLGDHLEVTGSVSEYGGLTELSPPSGGVRPLSSPAEAVKPAVVVLPRTAAQRESLEGMLVAPQGDYTVSDNYSLNRYAEIGLAQGDQPLWQPTEVADPHDAAAIAAVEADNAARSVTLDDGASTNFFTSGQDTPLPWLTQDHEIRVGARASFAEPVVLDHRNGAWKLQPTSQLTADEALPVTFARTRTAAPAPTGGNVRVASFNVLNYFPTTGEEFVASGGSCSWYDDRDGNHITVNSCTSASGDGPRGAADAVNLQRQQDKIVHAINALGADVVSLEEIENSARFGKDRDTAVSRLVDALNAEAGAGTWQFVPTPPTAGDQSDEDVIRTAFIYRTASVEPVGDSVIDDAPAFDIARDPLAQAFQPVGGNSTGRFLVIVNHFKSKGSGTDDGTGQGKSNPERIAQARELVAFADRTKADAGTDKVFLSGDFNSYTREDPMQVLHDAGYTDLGSALAPGEHTYLFDGVVGSLDHVLANDEALGTVTGAHVWNINSVEPVALEYSRFNYNATDFYDASPYRASDHDPLVVGLDLASVPVDTATAARVSPDPLLKPRGNLPQDGSVVVSVTSPDDTVDAGTVEVYDGPRLLGTADVVDGTATIALPAYDKKGSYTLSVRYLGAPLFNPSETTTTFTVSNR